MDELYIETLEAVSAAAFLKNEEKLPYIRLSIRKLDVIKLLIMILWESRSLDNQKYATLSEKLDEVGRQLGGWLGQLTKTHPNNKLE